MLTIQIAIALDGFKFFRQVWEAPDNKFIKIQKKDITWPAYLADRELPALRRFQEALVEEQITRTTACYPYYHHLALHYRYLAKAEIFLAYKLRSVKARGQREQVPDIEEQIPDAKHWVARMDFGEPVKMGIWFMKRQIRSCGPISRDSSLHEEFGQSLDILNTAYGKGFLAFISPTITHMSVSLGHLLFLVTRS